MCWESCANTLYVSAIFPSEMLDAQVHVCLSVGLKCRKFCWESCANTLYVSTIFPSEMLAAHVLVCLSVGSSVGSSAYVGCTGTWVGLKCWKLCWESCANRLYVSTIFRSEGLAAQALLVCVHISWFEVLEVAQGELC